MQLYEEFIEALTRPPVKDYGGTFTANGITQQIKSGTDNTTWLKKELLTHVEDCHLFILSMGAIFPLKEEGLIVKPEDAEGMKSMMLRKSQLDRHLDLDVAPPFQTCWFQFAEPGHGRFSGIVDRHDQSVIYSMFLHETAPHEYLFCFIMRDDKSPDLRKFRFGKATQLHNHQIWHTISIWLQPFSKEATTGTMKTSTRVKFKHPVTGQKVLHKLKKVVMVYPKKMSAEDKRQAEAASVDFSHRFSVRGHWRKVKGIGKNRADEYVVQGYTYVREHERGPEDMPLVKKTRVVPEPSVRTEEQ